MTAHTPTHGPDAMIVPAQHRKYRWSFFHGVYDYEHGKPERADFTIWDQEDFDAYRAGYRDAERGAIRQKGATA